MINNIAIYTGNIANEHHKKTIELYNFLSDLSPIPVALNPSPKTIQNANVFITDYRRELLDLDDSNEIIFLCRGNKISNKQWLMIPSVDIIVTNTLYEGLQVSWQLQSKGFNKYVVHLLPWTTPKEVKGEDPYVLAMDDRYKNAFLGRKLQNTNRHASVRICLTEKDRAWPYNIVEGMLSGAIPIVSDRAPFNELIVNGHNGFLIRNPGDIVDALQKINEIEYWLSHNAKASMHARLNPTRYLSSLLYLRELPPIKLDPVPVEYSTRKWLVRERILQDGQIRYSPDRYGSNFSVIDLNEIQEVLSYFLTQEFAEVYIFGCDIPEEFPKRDLIQLMRMLRKIGSKSMNIHFCRDEPIPKVWEKIFARLSIISVEEGLKQVLS